VQTGVKVETMRRDNRLRIVTAEPSIRRTLDCARRNAARLVEHARRRRNLGPDGRRHGPRPHRGRLPSPPHPVVLHGHRTRRRGHRARLRTRIPLLHRKPPPDRRDGKRVETAGNWRTSGYSGANGGECVEVATTAGAVMVRDTKDQQRRHAGRARQMRGGRSSQR
jgi:hypothetical protein